MVVRKPDANGNNVTKFAEKDKPQNIFSYDALDSISVDDIEVTDYLEKGKAAFSRVYQIYEGELQLTINDEHFNLHKGDGVFIEKGTVYEMKGTYKAIAVNKVAY